MHSKHSSSEMAEKTNALLQYAEYMCKLIIVQKNIVSL